MSLPWINTTKNPFQRAQQIINRGKPLTNSYPVGTFFVTAQNGQPLAPGQPSGMNRIILPGLQQSGDPRTTGSFYDISTDNNLQSLITGGSPITIKGGNNTNNVSGNASSYPILFIVAGLLAFVFFIK